MRKKRIYGHVGLVAVVAFGMTAKCLSAAKAPTTTSLTALPSTAPLGQLVTLTATISAGTGNVTFYDEANIVGVAPVVGVNAILNTTLLPAGLNKLTARYDGDATHKDSVSSPPTTVLVTPVSASAFKAPLNDTVGTWPVSLAVGDFDGDLIADVAVVNYGSNTVSVLIGLGNGMFKPAQTFAVGVNPHAVAVGDFNGDGKMDLAVVNMGGNVSILINNGTPTLFNAAVGYPAGATPYAIAVADFDKDGNADLAIVDDNVGVNVLLGNGDGTFQAPLNNSTVAPSSVAVAFFDGDKNPDLVVADPRGSVSILLGNGDGTFLLPHTYLVGSRPYAVYAGDLNSGGMSDVAVTDYAGKVWVFLGDGAGGLGAPAGYSVGFIPTSIGIGDFDGDGHQDMVVTSSYSNNLNVLLGSAVGTFHLAVNYSSASILPCSVAVSDFNGDGRSDLVVANFYNNNVSVWLGDKFSISVTSGSGQSTRVTTFFPLPLKATVKDSLGGLVTGAVVTFTAPPSGASATFAGSSSAMVTTAAGIAQSPPVRANSIIGSNYIVTASVGFEASTNFLLSNAP